MGSTWLILSPGSHPSTGNQNVWFGPSPPTPGPAPAPLPWRWEAVEGIADFGRVGMGWGGWGREDKMCVWGEEFQELWASQHHHRPANPTPTSAQDFEDTPPPPRPRYWALLPRLALAEPWVSCTPRDSTPHLPTRGPQPLPLG